MASTTVNLAKQQKPDAQLRVTREERSLSGLGRFIHYRASGTAAQLIEHGLCEEEWFPKAPKRVAYAGPADSCHWNLKRAKAPRWELFLSTRGDGKHAAFERAFALFGDAVVSPEPEAELFADQREGENYVARLFLQNAFDFGPMDEAAARAAVIDQTRQYLACANAFTVSAGGQFFTGPFSVRLSEEEREDLDEAIETIRRLAHYGKLVRDQAMSARIEKYRSAKAARANKPLQSFLDKVTR